MKRMVLLLAGLAMVPSCVQAGESFRWVDKAGKVNYGDTPPVGVTDVERIKLSSEPAQSEDLPYETRLAQQNFPVTLYVADGCGESCDQAHSLLNKRGIPFSEKLLRTRQDVEAFKQLSGISGVVPVLQVGKDFLKGFSDILWNGALDVAGYPKTASKLQHIAPPALPQPFTPSVPVTPPAEGQSPEGQSPQSQAAPAEPAAQ